MKADNTVEKISKESRCAFLYTILNSSIKQLLYVYDMFIYSNILFIYFIFIGILPTCMSVHVCMPGVDWGQKRSSDVLELELKMIVSWHIDPET